MPDSNATSARFDSASACFGTRQARYVTVHVLLARCIVCLVKLTVNIALVIDMPIRDVLLEPIYPSWVAVNINAGLAFLHSTLSVFHCLTFNRPVSGDGFLKGVMLQDSTPMS